MVERHADEFRIDRAEDLGRVVREARARAGWTQEELADFVEADRVYIGRVERGAESTRLQRVLRILQGLGYDLVVVPRRPRPFDAAPDDEGTTVPAERA